MMYIDNRFLIPILPPLVFVGAVRLLFWLAGAEITRPDLLVSAGLIVGLFGALIAAILLFFGEDIGGFWIGGRK